MHLHVLFHVYMPLLLPRLQEEILLSCAMGLAMCNLLASLRPDNAPDYVYLAYFLICAFCIDSQLHALRLQLCAVCCVLSLFPSFFSVHNVLCVHLHCSALYHMAVQNAC
jgi:hypothetical protein